MEAGLPEGAWLVGRGQWRGRVQRRGGSGASRSLALTKAQSERGKAPSGGSDLSSGLGGIPRSPVRSLRVRSSICSCTGRNPVKRTGWRDTVTTKTHFSGKTRSSATTALVSENQRRSLALMRQR